MTKDNGYESQRSEHKVYKNYEKEYWEKHKEATKKYKKIYRKNHKDQIKDSRLKRQYGITLDDYNSMLIQQNYCCKICGKPQPKGKPLHVDHCHKTGKFRGLVCTHCNRGLGSFYDNVELLQKAIDYLSQQSS